MNGSSLAPIILFVYNRPEHTRKTLAALKNNIMADQSDLYIYSDGKKELTDPIEQKVLAENIEAVRNIIHNIQGFKNVKIIEKDHNHGLAASIINGVSEIIQSHGKVIVLEDDIITAPGLIKYMNEALAFYQEKKDIFSISGYIFPYKQLREYEYDTFIYPRNSTWGWATWKDRWEKADWNVRSFNSFIKDKKEINKFNRGGEDLTPMLKNQMNGKIDSWGIRWCYTQFKNNAYGVFPVKSLVQNIGFDDSGIHCEKSTWNDVLLNTEQIDFKFLAEISENPVLINRVAKFFKKTWLKRVKEIIKKIIKPMIK
ncbi:MAG: glycosyltransferase [Spirochaetes bacterium]|nr:glycosyltransferase [Spirochaetota bacterium]